MAKFKITYSGGQSLLNREFEAKHMRLEGKEDQWVQVIDSGGLLWQVEASRVREIERLDE